MKYDYIYSEAVEIITAKKDDGTKFLSKDTLCVAVTEDDKLYSAFNTINMIDGKPVTGSSEKEVVKKISGGDNKRIAAMITMNCVEMVPVLPAKEDIEEIIKLDKYNAATDVVSPNNKYIKLKDLGEYKPDGDNSSIEILKVDITAKRSAKEKLMSFVPDFEKETDDGETKSETKYLFAMPGQNNNDANNGAPQPQSPDGNMQGQAPFYTMDDVVHQYQPVDGRHRGINASQMTVNNRSQMSVHFATQNVSQQIPQGMMQGQQSVMLGQYGAPNQPNMMPQGQFGGQQGSVQGQYGAPNQMMNGQYMQQNMMNGQYIQQGMMPNQYGGMPAQQQNMMNGQYMQQGMMPNQYGGMPAQQQNMMNGQYMQQGMMPNQYGGMPNQQQNMMNGQYMQQGMMQGQYGGQNMMNGQYMQQGMMPNQYGQNMMNGQYMQGQGMMNGQYMQQQEEINPQYLQQNNMNDGKNK